TRSTSVKVPIAELKYRIAWSLTLGSDSRSGNVAVWVMTAEGGGLPGGEADRSCRPSSGRTAGASRRRGRRQARGKKRRLRTFGRYILRSLTAEAPAPGRAPRGQSSGGRHSGSPAQ